MCHETRYCSKLSLSILLCYLDADSAQGPYVSLNEIALQVFKVIPSTLKLSNWRLFQTPLPSLTILVFLLLLLFSWILNSEDLQLILTTILSFWYNELISIHNPLSPSLINYIRLPLQIPFLPLWKDEFTSKFNMIWILGSPS